MASLVASLLRALLAPQLWRDLHLPRPSGEAAVTLMFAQTTSNALAWVAALNLLVASSSVGGVLRKDLAALNAIYSFTACAIAFVQRANLASPAAAAATVAWLGAVSVLNVLGYLGRL